VEDVVVVVYVLRYQPFCPKSIVSAELVSVRFRFVFFFGLLL